MLTSQSYPLTIPKEQPGRILPLVIDASKSYQLFGKTHHIFTHLTIYMQQFTRLALIGPNGCGKSTLVRIILGIQPVDEGQVGVTLEGQDLLGAVLQDYRSQLLPWISVERNILLPFDGQIQVKVTKKQVLSSAKNFLEELGYDIPFTSPVQYLSGGQQQAIVLARALSFHPNFLIWDEPMSAIDFARRGTLYRLLQRYWRETCASVIFVTHDLDQALILADRILIFDVNLRILRDWHIDHQGAVNDASFLETEAAQHILADIRTTILGGGKHAHSESER